MKKIIEGKVYNTETAYKICELEIMDNGNLDCVKTLYKTKKGVYFIETYAYSFFYSNDICVVNENDAMEFCEKSGDVEAYIKNFGEEEA